MLVIKTMRSWLCYSCGTPHVFQGLLDVCLWRVCWCGACLVCHECLIARELCMQQRSYTPNYRLLHAWNVYIHVSTHTCVSSLNWAVLYIPHTGQAHCACECSYLSCLLLYVNTLYGMLTPFLNVNNFVSSKKINQLEWMNKGQAMAQSEYCDRNNKSLCWRK